MSSACAVDVSVFNKEIVRLFKTHPKCQTPKQLHTKDVIASLSTKGVMSVDLPPQRTFTTLPVRAWAIELKRDIFGQEAKDSESKDVTGGNSNFEMTIPARIPSENQGISFVLQKAWMKTILSLGSKAELFLKIAAIDAFQAVSPSTEWCRVAYTAPTRTQTQAEEQVTERNGDLDEKENEILVEAPFIGEEGEGEGRGDLEGDDINMADLL